MRKLPFLLILLLASLPWVSAQTSGSSLVGRTEVDLNVTLLNVANYPQFIVLNPGYKFEIFRADRTGETLNNATGFWIMPYETVKITFQITENSTYSVAVPSCGEGELTCGVLVPPLINYPKVWSLSSMLSIRDGNVKILSVDGLVRFNVTNGGSGPVFFAMAPPVVFSDAITYGYYPNYTMNYSGYIGDFVWKFRGVKPPQRAEPREPNVETTLFNLTPTLLSGVKVPEPKAVPSASSKFDFPVWIVFMKKDVVVTYRVRR